MLLMLRYLAKNYFRECISSCYFKFQFISGLFIEADDYYFQQPHTNKKKEEKKLIEKNKKRKKLFQQFCKD